MVRKKFSEEEKKERKLKSRRKSYAKNRKKVAITGKKYRELNREKIKLNSIRYRKANYKKINANSAEYTKRAVDNLLDSYIKKTIYKDVTIINDTLIIIKKTLLLFNKIIQNRINKIKAKEIMVTIQANLKKESKQLQKLIKMMLISMEQYIDGDITLSQAKTVASMGNTTYKAIAGKVTLDQALLNQ